MLATFSGLDGAGKSTLIADLKAYLLKDGRPTQVLTIYDDVSLYGLIRKLRDSLRPIRAPGAAEPSTDPDRLGPKAAPVGFPMNALLSLLRSRCSKRCVLFADLAILLSYRMIVEGCLGRILILDRYLYDSLADVVDDGDSAFAALFIALAPEPDLPLFIDVSPEVAFARKGEYAVDYMTRRRGVYENIFRRVKRGVILKNDRLDESTSGLRRLARERLLA